jgi:hypothetical protein
MSKVISELATDAKPRQVNYDNSAKEILREFFGCDLSEIELANLVGAISDAVILVESRGDKVFVQIRHPKLKIHDVFIAKNSKNQIFVRIDEIEFYAFHRGQKEGVKMLLRQIKQARKLKVAYLEAEADGNPKTFHRRNGYYVWARLGFNAPLSPQKKAVLPDNLRFIKEFATWRETRTLNDLLSLDGHQWWRENGEERLTFFDLNENSSSLKILEKYVLELKQENKL